MYCNHFSVARLPPQQDGTIDATVSFSLEGTLSRPAPAQLEEVKNAANNAFQTRNWEAVRANISNSFVMEDGAPMHAGAKGFALKRILTTVLVCTGGTKSGRLANGVAARAVSGKGRVKDKGKAVAQAQPVPAW